MSVTDAVGDVGDVGDAMPDEGDDADAKPAGSRSDVEVMAAIIIMRGNRQVVVGQEVGGWEPREPKHSLENRLWGDHANWKMTDQHSRPP